MIKNYDKNDKNKKNVFQVKKHNGDSFAGGCLLT